MLSDDTLRLYRLVFKVAAATNCVPLAWDPETLKLQPIDRLDYGKGQRASSRRARQCLLRVIRVWARRASNLLELVCSLAVLVGLSRVARHNAHNVTKLFEVFQVGLEYAFGGLLGMGIVKMITAELACVGNTLFYTNSKLRRVYQGRTSTDARFNLICKAYIVLDVLMVSSLVIFFMLPAPMASESLNLVVFFGGPTVEANVAGRLAFSLLMGYIGFKTSVRLMFVVLLYFGPILVMQDWLRLMKSESLRLQPFAPGNSASVHAYQSAQVFNVLLQTASVHSPSRQ